jgi:L-rhamnose mutarotase
MDYFAWETECHQIAKPTLDRNKIPSLFEAQNTYFIYVCIKDEERHVKKINEKERREKEKKKMEKKAKRDKMKQKGR